MASLPQRLSPNTSLAILPPRAARVKKRLSTNLKAQPFDARLADLRGMSVSVHDGDRWRQTWVDSNDTYLDFAGGWAGDEFELLHVNEDACFRMRFTEIAADSLVWLWERRVSAVWELKWRIDYARRSRGSR